MSVIIPLTKIQQKNRTFYLMSADPRVIISKCKYEDANKLQEYQRPWNPKRVKTIADYVHGDLPVNDETTDDSSKKAEGFIPNCPLLNTISDVIVDDGINCHIELPDGDDKCFEILDGQHRLIAFNKDLCRIPDDEKYEMGFVVCDKLTGNLKKEIFVIPNRTQEKVDKDVILSMMESLNILDEVKTRHYRLLTSLNKEESSPLKGRIKIGGEKVKNGLAPKAMMKIFDTSELVTDHLDKLEPSEELECLIAYLNAWYSVFPETKTSTSHTLNKIAGIRYMMILGQTIAEVIQYRKIKWTQSDLESIIRTLRVEITDPEETFAPNKDVNPFAGESLTVKIAKVHSKKLMECVKGESYNIFQ